MMLQSDEGPLRVGHGHQGGHRRRGQVQLERLEKAENGRASLDIVICSANKDRQSFRPSGLIFAEKEERDQLPSRPALLAPVKMGC